MVGNTVVSIQERVRIDVIAGNEEPYGLTLKDALDDYYEQDTQHGRLSPNLDPLVEKFWSKKERLTGAPTPTN